MAKYRCTSCGHKWDIKKQGPFCPKCELKKHPDVKYIEGKLGK